MIPLSMNDCMSFFSFSFESFTFLSSTDCDKRLTPALFRSFIAESLSLVNSRCAPHEPQDILIYLTTLTCHISPLLCVMAVLL